MNYATLTRLHPNLLLLLQRVCTIEHMSLHDLIEQINLHRASKMRLDTAIGVFCANYFAQSSTLQGHEAARHGQGPDSIRSVSESIGINAKRYDLSLHMPNNHRMSADHQPAQSFSLTSR